MRFTYHLVEIKTNSVVVMSIANYRAVDYVVYPEVFSVRFSIPYSLLLFNCLIHFTTPLYSLFSSLSYHLHLSLFYPRIPRSLMSAGTLNSSSYATYTFEYTFFLNMELIKNKSKSVITFTFFTQKKINLIN